MKCIEDVILDERHQAIWFFTLDNHDNVGFLAKINGENETEKNKLVDVTSLNIGDVEESLLELQQLWNEVAHG